MAKSDIWYCVIDYTRSRDRVLYRGIYEDEAVKRMVPGTVYAAEATPDFAEWRATVRAHEARIRYGHEFRTGGRQRPRIFTYWTLHTREHIRPLDELAEPMEDSE